MNSAQEQLIHALSAQRRVRAVAQTRPLGALPLSAAWTESAPLLSFERGLGNISTEGGLERWPFEWLERWSQWEAVLSDLASGTLSAWQLGQLASSHAVYDPANAHRRVSTLLAHLGPAELKAYRQGLLARGGAQLRDARRLLLSGSGVAAQLLSLVQARRVALECAYPALLSALGRWPRDPLRLPHIWRAELGLNFPKAVDTLETLYAFGSQAEARRVLLATRGLNLVAAEKHGQQAFQAGYYDGAVRLLRDESAQRWRSDIERWTYLSSARREKLSLLLGAEKSPLGPVALALAEQLLGEAGQL